MLVAVAAMIFAPPSPAAPAPLRLVYTSDWTGAPQLYAADPSGAAPTRELMSPCGGDFYTACNGRWMFSPDGRRLLSVRWVSKKLSGVFVSDADGSHARVVETMARGAYPPRGLFWSPDARGFGWRDARGLHFVDARGVHRHVVLPGGVHDFAWSPADGAYAWVTATNELIVHSAAGKTDVAANGVWSYEWAPSGRWLVVRRPEMWSIVRPDGTGARDLGNGYHAMWSVDGRWLALDTFDGRLLVYDAHNGVVDTISPDAFAEMLSWSPVHDRLAFGRIGGPVEVADLDRGGVTAIGPPPELIDDLLWSPDGLRVAYLVSGPALSVGDRMTVDIEVAGLDGAARTLVRADGPVGGSITGLGWARLPPGTTTASVPTRSLGTTTPTSLHALWDVRQLATDGDKVAYEACGHVFVWTPATQMVEQADPAASLAPWCNAGSRWFISYLYDLALAGDDVLYAAHFNSTSTYWTVTRKTLGPNGAASGIDGGSGLAGFPPATYAVGQLAGAGSLLVYSRWQESCSPHCGAFNTVTSTTVERVEHDGSVTPLHVEPGPLVTGDVDGGRIAVYGTQAVLLLDRDGRQLLSLPVAALGVRLDGTDLAVLTQGHLDEYDTISGGRLHIWPVPDVTTGEVPGAPDFRTPAPALDLDDLAHGLALYHVNGEIHLLRLSDGQDAAVAPGTLARFTSNGLVYANGSTLTLVPFADLPLH